MPQMDATGVNRNRSLPHALCPVPWSPADDPVTYPLFQHQRRLGTSLWVASLVAVTSCGGGTIGSGTSPQAASTGTLAEKPSDGSAYFVDPHHGGQASTMRLVEMSWGRLVDIHDVDAAGNPSPLPLLRDFVVRESVITDATGYTLDRNPVTARNRLIVRRTFGAPDDGSGTFEDLLRAAQGPLPAIQPRALASSTSIPFSLVPRNACIVLRFDDLLDDDAEAVRVIDQILPIHSGYPPTVPFQARLLFDPNHGGVLNGSFHSSRVLVDLTISQAETIDLPTAVPPNPVGLPPSRAGAPQANIILELPFEVDPTRGQFHILRNLSGARLAAESDGPIVTSGVPALQRGLRSGNLDDTNNGFLLDVDPPRILGDWPVTLESVVEVPGSGGFDFTLDICFSTVCSGRPVPGDVLVVDSHFLEVVDNGPGLDAAGCSRGVHVRSLALAPTQPTELLGQASFRIPFDPTARIPPGCWVRFRPNPRIFPTGDVAPNSDITVLFSESMDPASFDPGESFQVIRGPAGSPASYSALVVGSAEPSDDLLSARFTPSLPFSHQGQRPPYHVRLVSDPSGQRTRGLTDLAGNVLAQEPPLIEFDIDPTAPQSQNGGFTQRFGDFEELPSTTRPDLRGNVFVDLSRGVLRPRPVDHVFWPVDRTVPVPSIMIAFPPGIQTPLTPLGSKLHALWRYADVGWQIRDESKYDLDVTGVYWSPAVGAVVADFYPRFEMRLSHALNIPDEIRAGRFAGSKYPNSGLFFGNQTFAENILKDPMSPQKVVHNANIPYRVDPTDLSLSFTGTLLMPWPMNRNGGPLVTYTWRDTSVLALGGRGGAGVPLSVEATPPLDIENHRGDFAPTSEVPSVGLPLLMEFRCFPTASGIGLNPLSIALATNTSAQPNFRSFSTGGIDTLGRQVLKDPDLEIFPTGGFNPKSTPPGRPTRRVADNSLYLGGLDTVTRISRGHSVWFDTAFQGPLYSKPIVLPRQEDLPSGTQTLVEFRGADRFTVAFVSIPFNANNLDPYGNLTRGEEHLHPGGDAWTTDIAKLDGSRYFQMRYTLISNVISNISPEITSVAVAFDQGP